MKYEFSGRTGQSPLVRGPGQSPACSEPTWVTCVPNVNYFFPSTTITLPHRVISSLGANSPQIEGGEAPRIMPDSPIGVSGSLLA